MTHLDRLIAEVVAARAIAADHDPPGMEVLRRASQLEMRARQLRGPA